MADRGNGKKRWLKKLSSARILEQLARHLHIGEGSPPWEYVELQLIKLYHCSHDDLAEMDARQCLLDLAMESLAAQVRRLHI